MKLIRALVLAALPATVAAQSLGLKSFDAPPPPTAADVTGLTRFDIDCVRFTFAPSDRESEAVWLQSREWEQDCVPLPRGGLSCHERPGWVYREQVWLTIPDRRPVQPWEKETFRVCLRGPWLYEESLDAAYKYDSNGHRQGGGTNIVLTPGARTPLPPDPDGIALDSFDGSLRLSFADKWAAQYAGDQTVLSIELREPGLFGAALLKKEIALAPAARYGLSLLDYRAEFSSPPEAGRNYLVRWGFKRVGKVSDGSPVRKGDSDEAKYQPAGAGSAR